MRRGKKTTTKRTMKIVPKMVLGSVFVGVLPAIIAACGDDTTTTTNGSSSGVQGVAQRCFAGDPSCPMGVAAAVAAACFDGSTNPSCPHPPPTDAAADGDAPADGDAARDVEAG